MTATQPTNHNGFLPRQAVHTDALGVRRLVTVHRMTRTGYRVSAGWPLKPYCQGRWYGPGEPWLAKRWALTWFTTTPEAP